MQLRFLKILDMSFFWQDLVINGIKRFLQVNEDYSSKKTNPVAILSVRFPKQVSVEQFFGKTD